MTFNDLIKTPNDLLLLLIVWRFNIIDEPDGPGSSWRIHHIQFTLYSLFFQIKTFQEFGKVWTARVALFVSFSLTNFQIYSLISICLRSARVDHDTQTRYKYMSIEAVCSSISNKFISTRLRWQNFYTKCSRYHIFGDYDSFFLITIVYYRK